MKPAVEAFERQLAQACNTPLGRKINLAAAWGAAMGTCVCATVGLALIFGNATFGQLGLCLIATGGMVLLYLFTER